VAELLSVENLVTHFTRRDGEVKAVDGVSYQINERESVAIVGESGSGKSVGVLSLLRLLPKNGKVLDGKAVFRGRDLLRLPEPELRKVRGGEIGFVFQNPLTALNPTMRCGDQIAEPLVWHNRAARNAALEKAVHLLREVGIPTPETRAKNFPFEFSGGMRQRVMIALALSCEPKLIVADEPTTALDVTIQAQIIDLLNHMKQTYGMSTILITHDIGLAAEFADRVIVMYGGRVVETAPTRELLSAPRHPYSIGLLENARMRKGQLSTIPGQPPDMVKPPTGCRFHPRCAYATEICAREQPGPTVLGPGHVAYCWNMDEVRR
jgi:oligopeptide/dipeptide ABC transporter ATP-binding protein